MSQVATTPLMLSHQRLLLVDDNKAIHEDYYKILNSRSSQEEELDAFESLLLNRENTLIRENQQFDIDSAYQGQEALERVTMARAEGRPYSVAFMDVRMPPGWDGIETTAKIWEVDPELQVVLCTAYSDYSWDDIFERIGQSDRLLILRKPFDTVEVLQLANALTEKWRLLQDSKRKVDQLQEESLWKEKELEYSENRYHLIAEHSSDLILILDEKGVQQYNSPSFGRLLGYNQEHLLKHPLSKWIHDEDQELLLDAIDRVQKTQSNALVECRIRHKDDRWLTLECQIDLIPEDSSILGKLIISGRDITARKSMELEQKQMEVNLRHAQKMESIGQLAAGIAHEINTPTQYIGDNTRFVKDSFNDLIGMMKEFKQLLLEWVDPSKKELLGEAIRRVEEEADWDYLGSELPKALDQTLEGVGQVSRIVKAMKEFSHPGTDSVTQVDLNRAIESTVTVARNEWKYVADVQFELQPDLPLVDCLPGELNQVVLNLVTNAAHAIAGDPKRNPEVKGLISLTTKAVEGGTEIIVQDNGPGIPDELKEKVFEPFFTTKEVGKGTGQGLAIVHAVVIEKHGGKVRLDSKPGEGTCFTLWIPKEIPGKPSNEEET